MVDQSKKAKVMAMFSERYDAWEASQVGQTSAYEYERSFDEFMQQMGQQLLQHSVGEEQNAEKKVCKVGTVRLAFLKSIYFVVHQRVFV